MASACPNFATPHREMLSAGRHHHSSLTAGVISSTLSDMVPSLQLPGSIAGHKLNFLLDTGATANFLSLQHWDKIKLSYSTVATPETTTVITAGGEQQS